MACNGVPEGTPLQNRPEPSFSATGEVVPWIQGSSYNRSSRLEIKKWTAAQIKKLKPAQYQKNDLLGIKQENNKNSWRLSLRQPPRVHSRR
jgi:hypothetical protein